MFTLGFDIGSSAIKVSLLDVETGQTAASAVSPKQEMPIIARRPGWAEQDPEMWWKNLSVAVHELLAKSKVPTDAIAGIGISYQMHGLVVLDKTGRILRPSIIWCDSRAVEIGNKAFDNVGKERCLESLLNSPGNFTASKLRWMREQEPQLYGKIHKFMLPGDYIAFRLTGEMNTTVSGLSEGILWDFKNGSLASLLLKEYEIDERLVSPLVPTFGEQGKLTDAASKELGLKPGIPVTYRAGDQPNNAFSLNVLEPGEIAATAGTSGVVYGVSGTAKYDPASRVNSFIHVNHKADAQRIGVLLCINGTGIAMSWIRRLLGEGASEYSVLDRKAAEIPVGSGGLVVIPFGNGAERMLENRDVGAHLMNVNYNIHTEGHVIRAVQEGVACSFRYGMDIMKGMDIVPAVIRAGYANMFLSPVFRETLANVTGVVIELYNADGAQGAARGAVVGAGLVPSTKEAFQGLAKTHTITPDAAKKSQYQELYDRWSKSLSRFLAH